MKKKQYEPLRFLKVRDGVVCTNITAGKFVVPDELYEDIEEMCVDGRLYPYQILAIEFIKKYNQWVVEITEEDFNGTDDGPAPGP